MVRSDGASLLKPTMLPRAALIFSMYVKPLPERFFTFILKNSHENNNCIFKTGSSPLKQNKIKARYQRF
jgi:hypothetical protein